MVDWVVVIPLMLLAWRKINAHMLTMMQVALPRDQVWSAGVDASSSCWRVMLSGIDVGNNGEQQSSSGVNELPVSEPSSGVFSVAVAAVEKLSSSTRF